MVKISVHLRKLKRGYHVFGPPCRLNWSLSAFEPTLNSSSIVSYRIVLLLSCVLSTFIKRILYCMYCPIIYCIVHLADTGLELWRHRGRRRGRRETGSGDGRSRNSRRPIRRRGESHSRWSVRAGRSSIVTSRWWRHRPTTVTASTDTMDTVVFLLTYAK